MVRIGVMANRISWLDRRELMGGLGAATLGPMLPSITAAEERRLVPVLHAQIDVTAGPPERPDALGWQFFGAPTDAGDDPRRGQGFDFTLANELPVPVALNWHGLDGVPSAEPLIGRAPLPAGERENLQIPFRRAGTFFCDLRLLGDGQGRPSRALATTIQETEPVAVDRDEIFLIEDWRLRPDGTAIAPGIDPKDVTLLYTINRRPSQDVSARTHDRLRLRFINGCQRSVIAVKIENYEVRVMALDSQPAEPFPARNGALVLAPGSRTDIFVDVTASAGTTSSILLHDGKESRPIGRLVVSNEPPVRTAPLPPAPPLPSNGLPSQLDLKNALRSDVTLGGPPAEWVTPINFAATATPAFRAKAGRTVVLALTNRAEIATVFHLHGHHFRLLDRLDDGWKPFWLDTLAIEPKQTQRIAFLAEYAGRWLMEAMAADWAAPRLVRWYSVE
jgi:FtsP/CotA-like multicopper oxidase with cupredoxin domain